MALLASAQKVGLGDGVNTTSRVPAVLKKQHSRPYCFAHICLIELLMLDLVLRKALAKLSDN